MSAAVQPASVQWSPTASQLAMAYSVCSGIARNSAKNFYYGFMVLPRPKREALCAVYAFMRRCDDISDDPSLPLHERRMKLESWLDALHHAYAGEPTDEPVFLALTDAQRRYQIPLELLDQLAFGTLTDVQELEVKKYAARRIDADERSQAATLTVQYQTFEDLRRYCYQVASVVGLVCIRIFGYRDPSAEPLAERCGIAFQLTNIIRDVKEDASLGRVYLPAEDLDKFGLSAVELLQTPDPARLRPLLELEAQRAREFYQSGHDLIPLLEEDSQPALWVLVTIYQRLLEKIALRQYNVFGEKIRLTVPEKLAILGRGFLKRLS
jgi:15-cis-phytoene synthase